MFSLKHAITCLLAMLSLAVVWQMPLADRGERRSGASGGSGVVRPKTLRQGPYRGMAVQLHGGPEVYEAYHRLVPEVANLGADTIMFVVHGWQTHAGSLDLRLDPLRTANGRDLGRLLDLAADHGLRRMIMPMVLLTDGRKGEWRGKIIPPGRDWNAWFKHYCQFILHFADIAERHRVEVLLIGSELIKTESQTELWRKLIGEVRQHYRGKLSYSANWDHYQTSKIGFWPELDFVGMTTYYELADGPNPSIQEVGANWEKLKARIQEFQREVGKPILFTEVGWCSQEGAAHEGWNYYANQEATPAGHREQAILYEAFMNAWREEPGVAGTLWWEWDNDKGGVDDYGYTPRGKPAETLLRLWFANKRSSAGDGAASPSASAD